MSNNERQRKAVDHVNAFVKRISNGRRLMERLWFTSILFHRGIQWINFENTLGTFVQSNLRKGVPRPVTNRFAEITNDLSSYLLAYEPKAQYAPQSNSADDIRTSSAANMIVRSIENEVRWNEIKSEAMPWFILTGNTFLLFGYDADGGKMQEMMTLTCINSRHGGTCPYKEDVPADMDTQGIVCPECQKQGVDAPVIPVTDEMGKPETKLKPQGCLTGECINPFEFFFDYGRKSLEDNSLVVRIHSMTPEGVYDKWGVKIDEDAVVRRSELSARFKSGLVQYVPTGEDRPAPSVDVVEVWQKPTRKFPKGFYMIMVGEDQVVSYVPYPFINNDGIVYFPIVHIAYDKTPGTLYGRTPMFDLVEKQTMRNQVESLGEMMLSRMSNPVWIIPSPGCEIDPTGQIGQIIRWDPRVASQPPRRDEAPQMPPAFVMWIEKIDMEMRDMAGLNEISRGQRPLSVKTGYALQKLEEQTRARSTTVFANMTNGFCKVQWIMLEIFRSVMPAERYAKVFGRTAGWTVKKIGEADLKGGVDVFVEPGNAQPKTALERQAQLDLFIQSGLLDLTDPLTRFRVHQQYGMGDLAPEMDADLMQISREHDRFYRGEQIVRKPWDNDQLHYTSHLAEMKSESFEDLAPQMQAAFYQHNQEHLIQVQLQMQAAALQQQQQPQPQQGGQPG